MESMFDLMNVKTNSIKFAHSYKVSERKFNLILLFIQFNIRGVHTSAKAVTEEKKIL